jgi:hypothetical protein
VQRGSHDSDDRRQSRGWCPRDTIGQHDYYYDYYDWRDAEYDDDR